MPVKLSFIAVVSLLTFGLSLALPALEFHPSRKDDADYVWSGGQALILGWQAVFVLNFAWFANPAYFASLLLLLRRRWPAAAAVGSLALLLALHALALVGRQLPADEGGVNVTEVVRLGAGFYVWLAGMVAVIVGAHAFRRGSLQ